MNPDLVHKKAYHEELLVERDGHRVKMVNLKRRYCELKKKESEVLRIDRIDANRRDPSEVSFMQEIRGNFLTIPVVLF